MDDVVNMSIKGSGYVYAARVLSHSGTTKRGSDPLRFRVVAESGEEFECGWEDVNKCNAYIEYQQSHPDLPASTQAPIDGYEEYWARGGADGARDGAQG